MGVLRYLQFVITLRILNVLVIHHNELEVSFTLLFFDTVITMMVSFV